MRFIGRYPAEKCQPISGLVIFVNHAGTIENALLNAKHNLNIN